MSVTGRSTFQLFWQDCRVHKDFRAAVSLHSHTMYSEESLDIIPRWAVEYITGAPFDFTPAFWTPPLTPRQAYRLEEKQINRSLQLPALVSLTDHDDIRAASLLRAMDSLRNAPISTEWTVPFGPTFFHFGLHNLPASLAPQIMHDLAAFTCDPDPDRLSDLLRTLNSYPDLLIILNHPLWDEKGIGVENHTAVLRQLLERHASSIHALELNGLRSRQENRKVIAIGRDAGFPVVSGGDRHGREPNAILNLTRGHTLSEFVQEVRYERLSHVVFMSQYRLPLKLRILRTVIDSLRDYPENPEGRKSWTDRVFCITPASNQPLPLSAVHRRNPTAWKVYGKGFRPGWLSFSKLLKTPVAPLLSSRLHEWGSAGWKKDQP